MKSEKIDRIVNRNYQKRLALEREVKGLYKTISLPEGQTKIKLLPIQNLFYGSDKNPPRLQMLLKHIEQINDMEEGAFFLGGNLFYFPAGDTDTKAFLAERYADDISEILRKIDKNKLLFMYNGVNETKFLDNRNLKYPIETTKIIAQNLGIEDRYFADTKVELNFVFKNQLTNGTAQQIPSLFTSVAPISSTENAIATKLKTLSSSNAQKSLIVDTSSGRFYAKKQILTINNCPTITKKSSQTLISPAGYTDVPQLASSKKTRNPLYTVNTRFIELKIEPTSKEFQQDSIRSTNTIKNDEFERSATCYTIGVNYDTYVDYDLYSRLNDKLFENIISKEILHEAIDAQLDENLKQESQEIYSEFKNKQTPSTKKTSQGYTFNKE